MSDWSASSTLPSCTGAAVWLTGTVPPPARTGALGEPGSRSTKKLPSRKIRGRTFTVASAWIGRPSSEISIVTSAPRCSPGRRSTDVTSPTVMPAMRTGDFGLTSPAFLNASFSS